MTEMVLEVVRNYKVDGVKGDDRLPAMPAEGGYDRYTKNSTRKNTTECHHQRILKRRHGCSGGLIC